MSCPTLKLLTWEPSLIFGFSHSPTASKTLPDAKWLAGILGGGTSSALRMDRKGFDLTLQCYILLSWSLTTAAVLPVTCIQNADARIILSLSCHLEIHHCFIKSHTYAIITMSRAALFIPFQRNFMLTHLKQFQPLRNSSQAPSEMLSLKSYQKYPIPNLNSEHVLFDAGLKNLCIDTLPASSVRCWELQTILIYVTSQCG